MNIIELYPVRIFLIDNDKTSVIRNKKASRHKQQYINSFISFEIKPDSREFWRTIHANFKVKFENRNNFLGKSANSWLQTAGKLQENLVKTWR